MNNKLRSTLTRLGLGEIERILGDETFALLDMLNLRNESISRVDLVIDQLGHQELLLNTKWRNKLLEALSQDDALRLSRLLNISPASSPWQSLISKNYSIGSESANILFAFFGCPEPQQDQRTLATSISSITPSYKLFPHQIVAYQESINILKEKSRVLLHMPTGAGKTRTAMNIISYFLRNVIGVNELIIWVAHSEELCEQAADEFEKAWKTLGNRDIFIHKAFGDYTINLEEVKGGFLIASLSFLYKRSLSQQSVFLNISQRTPVVIMDEAHQAIAPTYKHLLELISLNDPDTKIIGLSATPGRGLLGNDENMELAHFFSKNKVTLNVPGYSNPVEFLQAQGFLANVTYEFLKLNFSNVELSLEEKQQLQVELDLPKSVLHQLGRDIQRNYEIVRRLEQEANANYKIILFACSVDHAHLIANILALKGFKAAALTGRTPPRQRSQLVRKYKDSDEIQILCNYGILTTGFDSPKTNMAFITRPTQSVVLYSQMVGRAIRGPKAGGNENCKVITVIDPMPGFQNIGEGFNYWEDIWDE
jgi:DNA repair protein RadD